MRTAAVALFLLPFLVLLAPAATRAQTTETSSARALGTGGAFRALAYDNAAIDLNPAGMSQIKRFDFEGGYYRTPDQREYALQVSLTDALTNAAATGFSLEYRKVRPRAADPGIDLQKYVLGVGFPLVPQKVWVGMNTKYVRATYPGAFPARREVQIYTGDFGVLWRPHQMLALAGTFDNLFDGNHREAPRGITGGAALLPAPWITLSADVFVDLASTDEDETGWGAGAQITPFSNVSLRAGACQDALTQTRIWTAGIGLNAETGTIDYSVRMPEEETEILTHFVTLSFFVF